MAALSRSLWLHVFPARRSLAVNQIGVLDVAGLREVARLLAVLPLGAVLVRDKTAAACHLRVVGPGAGRDEFEVGARAFADIHVGIRHYVGSH